MPRRRDCPWPQYSGAYIDLPDEWLGLHARRRDEAVEKARAAGLSSTIRDFAVSMALLDDWHLPGLNGNPDRWDFDQVGLPLIAWVNSETLIDFSSCWAIPKNSLPPSPSGLTEGMSDEANGSTEAS